MDAAATPEVRAAPRRRAIIVGATLAAATLVVGLVKIGRSFNYDEAVTYSSFINGGSIRRALTTQVVFNNHPMFSAVQAVAWRLGLVGETAQRLGPVVCGAVTVGAIGGETARRVGAIGGVTAGVVLLLNPVYFAEFRSLRGYSLATMCVVLAALAVRRSWHDTRPVWLFAQAIPMVIAVTTHAYSVVPIVLFAVVTVSLGRLRLAHVVAWIGAAIVAFVIQLPLLDDAIEQSRARGSLFRSDFPERASRLLLGQSWPAVILTAALFVVGAWTIAGRSRRHLIAVVACTCVFASVVLTVWLILQPLDLYARFFVSMLPFMAATVGVGASQLPRAVAAGPVVLIAAFLVPDARDTLRVEAPIREAGEVVDAGLQLGLEVCGYQAEPLRVYAPPIRLVDGVDDFDDCELYVSVLRLRPPAREAAGERFEARRSLGGGTIVWGDEAVLAQIVADG